MTVQFSNCTSCERTILVIISKFSKILSHIATFYNHAEGPQLNVYRVNSTLGRYGLILQSSKDLRSSLPSASLSKQQRNTTRKTSKSPMKRHHWKNLHTKNIFKMMQLSSRDWGERINPSCNLEKYLIHKLRRPRGRFHKDRYCK